MNKKRIFAIVVFVILGLFMYTFANPLNDESNVLTEYEAKFMEKGIKINRLKAVK